MPLLEDMNAPAYHYMHECPQDDIRQEKDIDVHVSYHKDIEQEEH